MTDTTWADGNTSLVVWHTTRAHDHVLMLDGESGHPDIDRVTDTAALYRVSNKKADDIIAATRAALGQWTQRAQALGLPRTALQQMEQVIAV